MKRRNFIRNASLGSIVLINTPDTFFNKSDFVQKRNDTYQETIFKNLSGFTPLKIEELESELIVLGGTFKYTISKITGLISSINVLGDEWLTGYIPDLWTSNANDPKTKKYYARYSPSTRVEIIKIFPYQIMILSKGLFATNENTPFSLNFEISYTFDIDGTILVDVKVSAKEDTVIRWLTLMEGNISNTCQFVCHENDLANNPRTCTPINYNVQDNQEIKTGGKYIPWFHFGNDKGGLELVFPHSDKRHASSTDSSPFPGGDPIGKAYDLFILKRDNQIIKCTSFAIRNHREIIGPNSFFKDTFYISALPGRRVRSETNSMQIQWIGPHQYRNNWQHPNEDEIKKWAEGGVNTIVGGANWYSGHYSNCSMPENTRKFLDICHKYGLKVIPYITFTDQEYPTPGFDKTGPKWRIEPIVEFNYRSQLMCYGAVDWQEHWKNEITQIFDQFPFDGLYIDFWAGKINCYNTEHGCVGPYGRFTIEGLRKMARIAREIVDTKTENGLILSNTNILPLAMINNWMDARLYGEWHNLEETDPLSLRIYYNSHRFGTGNVLLINKVPHISERTLSLSGLFQGNPVISHAHTSIERSLLERNALLLNAFGVNKSIALNKFEMEESGFFINNFNLAGTSIYHNIENKSVLICLSTFNKPDTTIDLGLILKQIFQKISSQLEIKNLSNDKSTYHFYIFEDKNLIDANASSIGKLAKFKLKIPSESYRNIWIKPAIKNPSVLYALSNGNDIIENFNPTIKELQVSIPSRARTSAETVIIGPKPKSIIAQNINIPIINHKGWCEGELPCNTRIDIRF